MVKKAAVMFTLNVSFISRGLKSVKRVWRSSEIETVGSKRTIGPMVPGIGDEEIDVSLFGSDSVYGCLEVRLGCYVAFYGYQAGMDEGCCGEHLEAAA